MAAYSSGNQTFSGVTTLASPSTGQRIGYPVFLPDDSGLLFETQVRTSLYDTVMFLNGLGQLIFDGGVVATIPSVPSLTGLTSAAGLANQEYVFWGTNSVTSSTGSTGGSLFFSGSSNPLGIPFTSPIDIFDATVNDSVGHSVEPVSVLVDSANNIYVLFSTCCMGHTLMFSRSVNQGSTFSTPVLLIESGEFNDLQNAQMIVEDGGAIDVVVEANFRDAGTQTISFIRSVDGGDTFSTTVLNPNLDGQNPSMAIDSCGGINVTWDNAYYAFTEGDIFLTRSIHGGAFSAPINLTNSPAKQFPINSQLAADKLGNLFAIWSTKSGYLFSQVAQHTCQ